MSQPAEHADAARDPGPQLAQIEAAYEAFRGVLKELAAESVAVDREMDALNDLRRRLITAAQEAAGHRDEQAVARDAAAAVRDRDANDRDAAARDAPLAEQRARREARKDREAASRDREASAADRAAAKRDREGFTDEDGG